MSTIDSIPSDLELNELWEQKGGSNWLAAGALDVRKLATLMKGRKARFITITATELPEHGGIVMDYHWDLDVMFPVLLLRSFFLFDTFTVAYCSLRHSGICIG